MLKGIPGILNPDLLKVLMEMGHGDELVLADGNYPCFGHAGRVLRCDGHGIPPLLNAILQLMPLDSYVTHPVLFMDVSPGDSYIPQIWDEYRCIIGNYEGPGTKEKALSKADFYQRASQAYAVVTTSETALYANMILKKGVVNQVGA